MVLFMGTRNRESSFRLGGILLVWANFFDILRKFYAFNCNEIIYWGCFCLKFMSYYHFDLLFHVCFVIVYVYDTITLLLIEACMLTSSPIISNEILGDCCWLASNISIVDIILQGMMFGFLGLAWCLIIRWQVFVRF